MKILRKKTTVDSYPYGRLRTKATFDVEFNPKKGMRTVFQTVNPKTGRINNPKKSTYSSFIVMFEDSEGKVKYKHFDFNGLQKMKDFFNWAKDNDYKLTFEEEKYVIGWLAANYKAELMGVMKYAFNTYDKSRETDERLERLETIHSNTKESTDYLLNKWKYKDAISLYKEVTDKGAKENKSQIRRDSAVKLVNSTDFDQDRLELEKEVYKHVSKLDKKEVKEESKEEVKKVNKPKSKSKSKVMAKKKATTTRKAAAPKKTAKAKRTRMSVNQMLESKSEAMKLAGCITLASACMREGKSPKEAKRIQNQKTTIVDSLRNNPDSKQVEEFMKKVRASNQRIYKALVSCNRTKEIENFFEAARATFKGASKSKSLPATI